MTVAVATRGCNDSAGSVARVATTTQQAPPADRQTVIERVTPLQFDVAIRPSSSEHRDRATVTWAHVTPSEAAGSPCPN
jgi:hypothetical protein